MAFPGDCEAATETRAAGTRAQRRTAKVEAERATQDTTAGTPSMASFGKDHWSTFAYIETRCVDHKGLPKREHMRCHAGRHPLQDHGHGHSPTRLKNGEIHNHDDWDCLDDCEREGLLNNLGSAANPYFVMTAKGHEVASQLRAHKAAGRNFCDFTPRLEPQ